MNDEEAGIMVQAISSSSLMIKRTFAQGRWIDNTLRRAEDVDLAVRLALNCYFVGSPEILLNVI